ncbi:unnamed protein product, partial [Meganyctiphanes norvegica]
ERYIGICHPLKSHKLSDLGRVVRFIIFIWLISLLSAFPLAVQYGIIYNKNNDPSSAQCNLKNFYKVLFEISTFVFFCTPMFLLLILYVKIGMELHRSANMARSKSIGSVPSSSSHEKSRNKAVIKMLVAVVIAFFICWAPFHAQRLLSIYGDGRCKITKEIFMFLTHISGIFYYLSTCINPILYHIMSNRFRNALKATVHGCLCTSSTHLDPDTLCQQQTLNSRGSIRTSHDIQMTIHTNLGRNIGSLVRHPRRFSESTTAEPNLK